MKATGIIRKVDELGRIVLPIELRRNLDIEERDSLAIFLEGDKIVLQKHEVACMFCDATDDLIGFRNKVICRNCAREIRNL